MVITLTAAAANENDDRWFNKSLKTEKYPVKVWTEREKEEIFGCLSHVTIDLSKIPRSDAKEIFRTKSRLIFKAVLLNPFF